MYNIIEDYANPAPGEGPFFTDYLYSVLENRTDVGLDKCEWNETTYPYLAKHKTRLIERFNREYYFREIGQETEARWQHFLQARLDEVAEHYDHMYKVFEENAVDTLGTGYTIKDILDRDTTSGMESTDTRKADNKYKDTPTSVSTYTLNNPTEQTVDESTDSYKSSGTGTQDDVRTTTKTQHDDTMIKELNYLVDNYKSIDNEFIGAFENMFVGIITIAS